MTENATSFNPEWMCSKASHRHRWPRFARMISRTRSYHGSFSMAFGPPKSWHRLLPRWRCGTKAKETVIWRLDDRWCSLMWLRSFDWHFWPSLTICLDLHRPHRLFCNSIEWSGETSLHVYITNHFFIILFPTEKMKWTEEKVDKVDGDVILVI